MGNCIIRTICLTFTTFNTHILINNRLAVLHTDCSYRANLHTRMSHTSLTLVTHLIHIMLTGITSRRNHLHKRRLIILLINITLLNTLCQMHRFILWPQRHTHSKTYPLSRNRPFSINTLTILWCISRRNLIRNCFNIIDYIV